MKKLLAEIFGDVDPQSDLPAKSQAEPTIAAPSPAQESLPETTADVPVLHESETAGPQQVAEIRNDGLLQRNENVATQQEDSKDEPVAIKPRRHGSAMPQ